MCRNHHDLLEMAVIESLPLRQFFNPNHLDAYSDFCPADASSGNCGLVSRWCPICESSLTDDEMVGSSDSFRAK
jgi:hypothetical protein